VTLAATAAGTWLREAAAVPEHAADGADATPSTSAMLSTMWGGGSRRSACSSSCPGALRSRWGWRPSLVVARSSAVGPERSRERSYQAYRKHGGGSLVRSTSKEVTD